jgi:hypothetical protein
MNADIETAIAQTFTLNTNSTVSLVNVSVESCKENGIVDMIVDLAPLDGNGEPLWSCPIASVTIPADQIPARQGGCSIASFEWVSVPFDDIPLAPQEYAIIMRSSGYSSISWRRSSTPDDPSNPYPGGTLWEYVEYLPGEGEGMSITNLEAAFAICGNADLDCCGVPNGDGTSCGESCGCTNNTATNYSAAATYDDGSCLYDQDALDASYQAGVASVECPPCANSDCPGDLTADGHIGVDDILSMLSLYSSSCSE